MIHMSMLTVVMMIMMFRIDISVCDLEMDLCCQSLVDFDRFYRDVDFVDGRIVGVLHRQNLD